MDFLIQLDHSLFQFINQSLSSSWQDVFFLFITDMHKLIWFKIIAYPALFGFYFYKYNRQGIIYFVFCLLSLGVTDVTGSKIIKNNVYRSRPFQTEGLVAIQRSPAHGKSFISNHAANMFAFATYATTFFPGGRFVFFGFATLIAYSRVYNGVHFPLDVICGALWGISISLIFVFLAKWFIRKFCLRKQSP